MTAAGDATAYHQPATRRRSGGGHAGPARATDRSSVSSSSASTTVYGQREQQRHRQHVPAIETKSMIEDQLLAMLRCQGDYTPSTCACSLRPSAPPSNGGGGGGIGGGVGVAAAADGNQSPRRASSFPFAGESRATRADFVAASSKSLPIPHDEWRSKICEWSYRVVDHFRYDREVVSVAVNYFDRFLVLASRERTESVDSRTYQLAAMTALYLSVKLHAEQQPDYDELDDENDHHDDSSPLYGTGQLSPSPIRREDGYPPHHPHHEHHQGQQQQQHKNRRQDQSQQHKQHQHQDSRLRRQQQQDNLHRRRPSFVPPRRKLKLLSFVELSRGQFAASDITSMERTMLSTLRWKVNPPTPMVFVSHLLRTMPSFVQAERQSHRDRTRPRPVATRRSLDRRRDLVLHVLHELSRYLTELSICLPDVSAVYPPGSIAYAAVLISLDLMSDTALPPRVRDDFLLNLSRLSGGTLDPQDDEVRHLVSRMGESFVPEMLSDDGSSGDGHPIAIAREAGLLDGGVERRCRMKEPGLIGHHPIAPATTTTTPAVPHEVVGYGEDAPHPPQPVRGVHPYDEDVDCCQVSDESLQSDRCSDDDNLNGASDNGIDQDEGYVSCEGEVWADDEHDDDEAEAVAEREAERVTIIPTSSGGGGVINRSFCSVIDEAARNVLRAQQRHHRRDGSNCTMDSVGSADSLASVASAPRVYKTYKIPKNCGSGSNKNSSRIPKSGTKARLRQVLPSKKTSTKPPRSSGHGHVRNSSWLSSSDGDDHSPVSVARHHKAVVAAAAAAAAVASASSTTEAGGRVSYHL